ncbi:MAG: isoprenylcysteine carboxylmethyltransferase family protein [Gammaproteobacteria bacterium]|jgi:protein-S-isoprenylcysteine O-methyltransferase Ste14
MLLNHKKPLWAESLAIGAYLLALFIFFWAIETAKELEFAFSDNVGRLITNGPFKLVRHPFYTSYIAVWVTSTLLFSSSIQWITLIGLILFYATSARKEEKLILNSRHANQYSRMKKEIGMFFPKATQWKSWISEKSWKSQS